MLSVEKRNEILEEYLEIGDAIAVKVHGPDVADFVAALILMQVGCVDGIDKKDYDEFIFPYVNVLCEEEYDTIEAQLVNMNKIMESVPDDADEDVREFAMEQCKGVRRMFSLLQKRKAELADRANNMPME